MTNLTETDKRLFATDCAALVHHIWQRQHPHDTTVRSLIETTRRHIQHEATAEELKAAKAAADVAEAAAWAAANADEDYAWEATLAAARAAWIATEASASSDVAAWAATGVAMDAVIWAARDAAVSAAARDAVDAATWAAVRAATEVVLAYRHEAYALGTAGELWEIDDGERLRGILR